MHTASLILFTRTPRVETVQPRVVVSHPDLIFDVFDMMTEGIFMPTPADAGAHSAQSQVTHPAGSDDKAANPEAHGLVASGRANSSPSSATQSQHTP